jgi:Flp pilus assembly pilin Flp
LTGGLFDRVYFLWKFTKVAFDKARGRHALCWQLDAVLSSQGNGQPPGGECMSELIRRLWSEEQGQDIAEYAVMLAVILVLVVGTIRLIGSNANTVFSNVASSIQ